MARFDRVPIANFSRVSGTVFRGAAPDADSLVFLSGLGVRTIIDLRKEGDETHAACQRAAQNQLNYFNISTGFFRMPDHVVAAFLAVSLHPHYQPMFVHCDDGVDRTSAMIAIYRIAVEGWPLAWALSEMAAQNFHPWQLFLKHAVKRFGDQMNPLNIQQRLWAVQELVESNLFTAK